MRIRPPRIVGGDNWSDQLRIGFLIDWLDSRPEHAQSDARALCRKARENDLVALAAAGLSNRLDRELYAGELAFTGHNDHALEYGVPYHAHVAGHLDVDELALGDNSCLTPLSATSSRRARRLRYQSASRQRICIRNTRRLEGTIETSGRWAVGPCARSEKPTTSLSVGDAISFASRSDIASHPLPTRHEHLGTEGRVYLICGIHCMS